MLHVKKLTKNEFRKKFRDNFEDKATSEMNWRSSKKVKFLKKPKSFLFIENIDMLVQIVT